MVEEKTLGKGTEQVIRKTLKEYKKECGNTFTKEMQERIIADIEYQNSLEGLYDQIHTWIDATDEDDKGKLVIAKTLIKLPYKVREKVLNDKVAFLFSSLHGTVLEFSFPVFVRKSDFEKIGGTSEDYIYKHKQPVIFLNLPPKTKEAEFMTTVAHEIAHFILDHHKLQGAKSKREANLIEREADDLCEKWGFGRAYKSYNPLTPR